MLLLVQCPAETRVVIASAVILYTTTAQGLPLQSTLTDQLVACRRPNRSHRRAQARIVESRKRPQRSGAGP